MKMSNATSMLILSCAWMVSCAPKLSENAAQTETRINIMPNDTLRIFAPGIISTPLNERDLAISPDGRELMYTLNTNDNTRRAIVMVGLTGNRVDSKGIAPFSGTFADIEPTYSPDGQKLFFASSRPLYAGDTTADYNIWYSERINTQWSAEAHPVSGKVNTDEDEFYPSVATNGNLYYTAAYKNGVGREDIYVSMPTEGVYGEPTPLNTNVNTANFEFNAYVSPDEQVIIFSSYGRADDMGGGDLYISTKDASGHWSKSRNAGPAINSNKLDYCPFIDFRHAAFYFTSNRLPVLKGSMDLQTFEQAAGGILNGLGNIYVVDIKVLGIPQR